MKLQGSLRVRISGLKALPKGQQLALSKIKDHDFGQAMRFNCRMAEDVNAAIADGFTDADGNLWLPNPKARAQLGKNRRGNAYLTFGVIDPDTDARYGLTWEG